MTKETSNFSFKVTADKKALPLTQEINAVKPAKKKVGRKPDSDEGARTHRVVAYLTETEAEKFREKHEDKPLSAVARKLILKDISDE